MSVYNKIFAGFVVSAILVGYECAFVDTLPKCKISDFECMRNLYQTIVHDIGEAGIPSLKIPPVDPFQVQNVSVSLLGLIDIVLLEGTAKGIKDCIFDKFIINIENEKGFQENTCDLQIQGHYQLQNVSPLIGGISRDAIRGDGNAKVEIAKLHLKFDFPFYAQKRDDGEIYIKCLYDDIKYDFEIKGKTVFFIDNLYIGDQDISAIATSMLNANWKFVMTTFGQTFIDKAMEFYFKFAGNFFDVVPTRYFILDDLTPYAKP